MQTGHKFFPFLQSLQLNRFKSHYNANAGIVKQNRNAQVLSNTCKFLEFLDIWNRFSTPNPTYELIIFMNISLFMKIQYIKD